MPRVITPALVAEFRSRLCDVAAEIIFEMGLEALNMRELAKRLRMSPMTAYRYFKDKDEILAALRARAFARLADRLEAARAEHNAPAARCGALCRAYVQFAVDEPTAYRLMFDVFQTANHGLPELAEQERRARSSLIEGARFLVEEGSLDGDPDVMGQALWSVLHGVVALHLAAKLDAHDWERVLSEALRAFLGAFQWDMADEWGGFGERPPAASATATLSAAE